MIVEALILVVAIVIGRLLGSLVPEKLFPKKLHLLSAIFIAVVGLGLILIAVLQAPQPDN